MTLGGTALLPCTRNNRFSVPGKGSHAALPGLIPEGDKSRVLFSVLSASAVAANDPRALAMRGLDHDPR